MFLIQIYKIVNTIYEKKSTLYISYRLLEIHAFQHLVPYLSLILATISGGIVVASLNLALASGGGSLFTVGDPLSIAFSRFLMPQSGLTVKVLLNDSVNMIFTILSKTK